MTKATVIELAKDISSAMDGDEFDSISDTIESEQIATILRTVYRDMVSNRNWPHLKKAFNLSPFSDTSLPTHMSLPDSVKEIVMLNYNIAKSGETRLKYREMKWQDNDAFLRRMNKLDNDKDTVDVVLDPTGVQLLIRNDKAPEYYTSFDDETLVFDSYDSAVDSTLTSSKFQGIAYFMPDPWQDTDDFIVDLPEEAFSAFFNEAKSLAFLELRQTGHAKAEATSRQQQRWLARKGWRVNGGVKYPNYGRASRKSRAGRIKERLNG